MGKKRLLVLLPAVFLLIGILVLFLTRNTTGTALPVLQADRADEIRLYYYRAVPGLKRAEALGLTIPVNQRIDLPGTKAVLSIDRVWYNNRNVVIFYHVEGTEQPAFLGGDLYLPGHEPARKTSYWGSNSIGRPNEKGIIYREAFYSCLTLPRIMDTRGNPAEPIERAVFKPMLSLFGLEGRKEHTPKVFPLKAVELLLDYLTENEPVDKIPLEEQLEFNDQRLRFYQADITPSSLGLYFQLLGSGRDRITRVQGRLRTNRGEHYDFDVVPHRITDYPYHYILELPPFHEIPEDLDLFVESLEAVGDNQIRFSIQTADYPGNRKTYTPQTAIDTLRNTAFVLEQIALERETVSIQLAFSTQPPTNNPHTRLRLQSPLPTGTSPGANPDQNIVQAANTLTIINQEWEYYDFRRLPFGYSLHPEEHLVLHLAREYWDTAETLQIALSQLSYTYEINREIGLRLIP